MVVPSSQRRGRRGALLAVALGIFCLQLDSFALNLALPTIGRNLGATQDSLQWTVSAYLLAVGTFMLGGGRLGDLYGRRRLLRLGLAGFGLGSLLCVLAPTLPLLVAARVLQGAGGALIMPVGLALVTNVYPAPLRGRATGLALGLGGVAMACGPFLGGTLTDLVSWRAIFWINVPITLAAIWSLTPTKESQDNTSSRVLDVQGLVLATVALACLAGYVDRAPDWGWASPASLGLLVGVLAFGVAFLRRQRHATAPLVNLALLANRPFVAVTASGAVANAATVVFLFVVPLSLQGLWGLTPVVAGVAFLAPSVLMAAAGPLAGRIRPEHASATMIGALLASAAALATAAHASTLVVYVLAASVCGAGLGLGNALTLVATQGMVAPARAGEAAGVTKTVVTVAGGLGIVVAAPVADPHAPASVASTVLSTAALGALVTAGILILLLATTRRSHRPAATSTSPGPRPDAAPSQHARRAD